MDAPNQLGTRRCRLFADLKVLRYRVIIDGVLWDYGAALELGKHIRGRHITLLLGGKQRRKDRKRDTYVRSTFE